jgi:hypothetical protein
VAITEQPVQEIPQEKRKVLDLIHSDHLLSIKFLRDYLGRNASALLLMAGFKHRTINTWRTRILQKDCIVISLRAISITPFLQKNGLYNL